MHGPKEEEKATDAPLDVTLENGIGVSKALLKPSTQSLHICGEGVTIENYQELRDQGMGIVSAQAASIAGLAAGSYYYGLAGFLVTQAVLVPSPITTPLGIGVGVALCQLGQKTENLAAHATADVIKDVVFLKELDNKAEVVLKEIQNCWQSFSAELHSLGESFKTSLEEFKTGKITRARFDEKVASFQQGTRKEIKAIVEGIVGQRATATVKAQGPSRAAPPPPKPSPKTEFSRNLKVLGLKKEYENIQARNGFNNSVTSEAFVAKLVSRTMDRVEEGAYPSSALETMTQQFFEFAPMAHYALLTGRNSAFAARNPDVAKGFEYGMEGLNYAGLALNSATAMMAAKAGSTAFFTGAMGMTAGISGLVMVALALFSKKDKSNAEAERWEAYRKLLLDVAERLEKNQFTIMDQVEEVDRKVLRGFLAAARDLKVNTEIGLTLLRLVERQAHSHSGMIPVFDAKLDQSMTALLALAQSDKTEDINKLLQACLDTNMSPEERHHLLRELYKVVTITLTAPALTQPNAQGILSEEQYTHVPHPGVFDYHVTTLQRELTKRGFFYPHELPASLREARDELRSPRLLSKVTFFIMRLLTEQYPIPHEPNVNLRITEEELAILSDQLPRLEAEMQMRELYRSGPLHRQLRANYLARLESFRAAAAEIIQNLFHASNEAAQLNARTYFTGQHGTEAEQKFLEEAVPLEIPHFDCTDVNYDFRHGGEPERNRAAVQQYPIPAWRGWVSMHVDRKGASFRGWDYQIFTIGTQDRHSRNGNLGALPDETGAYHDFAKKNIQQQKQSYWKRCVEYANQGAAWPCLISPADSKSYAIPYPHGGLTSALPQVYRTAVRLNIGEISLSYEDKNATRIIRAYWREGRGPLIQMSECSMVLPYSGLYTLRQGTWQAWTGEFINQKCNQVKLREYNYAGDEAWHDDVAFQMLPRNFALYKNGKTLEEIPNQGAYAKISKGELEINCQHSLDALEGLEHTVQAFKDNQLKSVARLFHAALLDNPQLRHLKNELNHAFYLWAGVMTLAHRDTVSEEGPLHAYLYGKDAIRSGHDFTDALSSALERGNVTALRSVMSLSWLDDLPRQTEEWETLRQKLVSLSEDDVDDGWLSYVYTSAQKFVEERQHEDFRPVAHNHFRKGSAVEGCKERIRDFEQGVTAAVLKSCVRNTEGDLSCKRQDVESATREQLAPYITNPPAAQALRQCYSQTGTPFPTLPGGDSVLSILPAPPAKPFAPESCKIDAEGKPNEWCIHNGASSSHAYPWAVFMELFRMGARIFSLKQAETGVGMHQPDPYSCVYQWPWLTWLLPTVRGNPGRAERYCEPHEHELAGRFGRHSTVRFQAHTPTEPTLSIYLDGRDIHHYSQSALNTAKITVPAHFVRAALEGAGASSQTSQYHADWLHCFMLCLIHGPLNMATYMLTRLLTAQAGLSPRKAQGLSLLLSLALAVCTDIASGPHEDSTWEQRCLLFVTDLLFSMLNSWLASQAGECLGRPVGVFLRSMTEGWGKEEPGVLLEAHPV